MGRPPWSCGIPELEGRGTNKNHLDCVASDNMGWHMAISGCASAWLPFICKVSAQVVATPTTASHWDKLQPSHFIILLLIICMLICVIQCNGRDVIKWYYYCYINFFSSNSKTMCLLMAGISLCDITPNTHHLLHQLTWLKLNGFFLAKCLAYYDQTTSHNIGPWRIHY